jgi:hypothetical protein
VITLAKRATVYLDPVLHKALRLQAVETSRSVSDLINDAVRNELAEEAGDLQVFEQRVKEPTMAFDVFVKGLKRDGIL